MSEYRSIEELQHKLIEIKRRGFIPTRRKGATGIGFTLETELDIRENNLFFPDFGEIELKSSRKSSVSLITLFTSDRGAWRRKQREVIQQYGTTDESGRINLYITLSSTESYRGLRQAYIDDQVAILGHENEVIAAWQPDQILKLFHRKIRHVVLVYADTKIIDRKEHFWYNEAKFCTGWLMERMVPGLIENSIVRIDLRLHLKDNRVRNHGTGFRIATSNLAEMYPIVEPLVLD